jgi:putative hydrolase of the HAD superfamily
MADLGHVDCWIFDLDNTLYHPDCDLFGQIDVRMGAYIQRLLDCDAAAARVIQKRYFHEHGTTLSGLMRHHGVEPSDFLDYVHDIDLSVLKADPAMRTALMRLPGRRMVFTNGDAAYAWRVLKRLGIDDIFDELHDIIACDYVPKPAQYAYDSLVHRHAIKPETALFAEDMAQNLRPAKAMGMTTIWVNNGSERGDHNVDHAWIDQEISHIGHWLNQITEKTT